MRSLSLPRHPVVNAVYSFGSFVVPIICTLLTVRIYLRFLGAEQYGLYLFLLTVINLASLADIGLYYEWYHTVARQRAARLDAPTLNTLFGATFTLYGIAAVIASSALLVLYGSGLLLGSTRTVVAGISWPLFGLMVLFFCLRLMVIPITVMPAALQRFDISAKTSAISLILTQLISVIVVYEGGRVGALLIIQVLSAVMTGICSWFLVRRLVPALTLSFVIDLGLFRRIVHAGAWVALQSGCQTILTQFDKLVLGFFMGPAAVTYYTNAQVIPEKMVGTVNSTTGVLFPLFSEASAGGGYDTARLFRRALRLSTPLILIASGGVAVYGPVLLRLWLGEQVASHSVGVLYILVLTYALLAWFSIVINVLYGLRKTKLLSFYSLILALLNCGTLFILIPRYGIHGAAIAYGLAVVPVPFFIVFTARRLQIKDSLFLLIKDGMVEVLKAAVVASGARAVSYFAIGRGTASWWSLALGSGLAVIIFFSIYFFGKLYAPEDRMFLDTTIQRVRQKLIR